MDKRAIMCKLLGVHDTGERLEVAEGIRVVSAFYEDSLNEQLKTSALLFFVTVVDKFAVDSLSRDRDIGQSILDSVYPGLCSALDADADFRSKLAFLRDYVKGGLRQEFVESVFTVLEAKFFGTALSDEALCEVSYRYHTYRQSYRGSTQCDAYRYVWLLSFIREFWLSRKGAISSLWEGVRQQALLAYDRNPSTPMRVRDSVFLLEVWFRLSAAISKHLNYDGYSFESACSDWRAIERDWVLEFERLVLICLEAYHQNSQTMSDMEACDFSVVLELVSLHVVAGTASESFKRELYASLGGVVGAPDMVWGSSDSVSELKRELLSKLFSKKTDSLMMNLTLLYLLCSSQLDSHLSSWRYLTLEGVLNATLLADRLSAAAWLVRLFPGMGKFWRLRLLAEKTSDISQRMTGGRSLIIQVLSVPLVTVGHGELGCRLTAVLKTAFDGLCIGWGCPELSSKFNADWGLYRSRNFLPKSMQLLCHWLMEWNLDTVGDFLNDNMRAKAGALLSKDNRNALCDSSVPVLALDKLFKAKPLSEWYALIVESEAGIDSNSLPVRSEVGDKSWCCALWQGTDATNLGKKLYVLASVYKYLTLSELTFLLSQPNWHTLRTWADHIEPLLSKPEYCDVLSRVPMSAWCRCWLEVGDKELMLELIAWFSEREGDIPKSCLASAKTMLAFRFGAILSSKDFLRMWRSVSSVADLRDTGLVGYTVYKGLLDVEVELGNTVKAKSHSEIPLIDRRYIFDGKPYRVLVLPPGDPRALLIGNFVGCCQHIGGSAKSIAISSYTEPTEGVLVVEDDQGRVLAESFIWMQTPEKEEVTYLFDAVLEDAPKLERNQFKGIIVVDSIESLYAVEFDPDDGMLNHTIEDTGLHEGAIQRGYLEAMLGFQSAGFVLAASTDQYSVTSIETATTLWCEDVEDYVNLEKYHDLGYSDVTTRYISAFFVTPDQIEAQGARMAKWKAAL